MTASDILLVETRLVEKMQPELDAYQWLPSGAPILIANCQTPIYLSVFEKNR